MAPSSVDLQHPVLISEAVVARELDGETVLLNLDSGIYFGLNEVGTRVWQLLGEGRPPAALIDILLAEYDVTRDVLQRDVQALLDRLAERGLVRSGGPAA